MSVIQPNDLNVLSSYNFIESGSNKLNNSIIGLKWIKEDSKWTQQLVKVNKQDATCWALFLRLFGIGKLNHITFSLDKICSYLSKYEWKEIKLGISDVESNNYKAFKTVCHLANRQIQSYLKKQPLFRIVQRSDSSFVKFFQQPFLRLQNRPVQLFKAVSDLTQTDFKHYWNPAINGRSLLCLQCYCLPLARGIELRFKNSTVSILPDQKITKEDMVNIEVGYRYEYESSKDDNYYYYPYPPYYSPGNGERKRPIRNEI